MAQPRRPPPQHSISSGWTNFQLPEMMVEHLTQEQQLEVFNIVQQTSPLDMEPQNMAQAIFLSEEVYRESREEMERCQDQQRWDRLIELGAIEPQDDEIYDWDAVDLQP